jgi:hypothetical protein
MELQGRQTVQTPRDRSARGSFEYNMDIRVRQSAI